MLLQIVKRLLEYVIFFGLGFIVCGAIITNGFDRELLEGNPLGFWTEHNSTDSYYCVWSKNVKYTVEYCNDLHEDFHPCHEYNKEHFCS